MDASFAFAWKGRRMDGRRVRHGLAIAGAAVAGAAALAATLYGAYFCVLWLFWETSGF
jgi:hypothetical protein